MKASSAEGRVRMLRGHLSAALAPAAAAASHRLPTDGSAAVVVVTGAAGYVGSHLCRKLLDRGHSVRGCVRDTGNLAKTAFLREFPEYGGRFTLHSADMTKPGAYDGIFRGAVTVFHPAEVFMTLGPGRDRSKATAELGLDRIQPGDLNRGAMQSSQYVVDSINSSGTVTRLVYTSSIASMSVGRWDGQCYIDESRVPDPAVHGPTSYAVTKRMAEHFFAYSAVASGGGWSVVIGNPSDIVGPIMSKHQATETWQGKIAGVLRGDPAPLEYGNGAGSTVSPGRPWATVDVRDVAECQIRLAESSTVNNGDRFLLASGDQVLPEQLGPLVMQIFPEYDCPDAKVPPALPAGAKTLPANSTVFMRSQIRNDKVCTALGFQFRDWDTTLRDTVASLVGVGGVEPRLRKCTAARG